MDPLRSIIEEVCRAHGLDRSEMWYRVVFNEIVERANQEGILVTFNREDQVVDT